MISLGKQCCGHGGLFTYVKEKYEVIFRPLYKRSQLYEALFVEIKAEHLKGKVIVGNIYRPSTKSSDTNSELDGFIKEFQPIIEKLDREKRGRKERGKLVRGRPRRVLELSNGKINLVKWQKSTARKISRKL